MKWLAFLFILVPSGVLAQGGAALDEDISAIKQRLDELGDRLLAIEDWVTQAPSPDPVPVPEPDPELEPDPVPDPEPDPVEVLLVPTDPRALNIWLTASGSPAQAKADFNAIPVVNYDAPEVTVNDALFPDIVFRFTTITSIRDALRYIRIPTGPWGTLSKQRSPPNHEFFGAQYAEFTAPPMPTSFVEIAPGTDIQAVIDAHPAGTDFRIKSGVHRNQSIVPKDGDTFTGESGAVLNGSVLLQDWVIDGFLWRHDGLSKPTFASGSCTEGWICQPKEDVFLNDVPLRRVATKDDVVFGTFAEEDNSVWIADDPAGQNMERSVTQVAISGDAENVVLRNLTFEKYASRAQNGAVLLGSTWVAIGIEARLNHGIGIAGRGGAVVVDCKANDNGQMGMGGWHRSGGEGGLVLGCEIARNNYAGFAKGWEAGGTKFVANDGMKVRYNCIHDNLGRGLWLDIDLVDVEMDNNISFGNENEGIVYEISYRGNMRGNVVGNNGWGFQVWLWGAQLEMQNSPGGLIEDNYIEANGGYRGFALIQQNRGEGILGPRNIRDSIVRRNLVVYPGKWGVSGAIADFDHDGLTNGNNLIDENDYFIRGEDGDSENRWSWTSGTGSSFKSWDAIHDLGNELNSTLTVGPITPTQFYCNG